METQYLLEAILLFLFKLCAQKLRVFWYRGFLDFSNFKNLAFEYFWPHFEKQDGRHRNFQLSARNFVGPLEQRAL